MTRVAGVVLAAGVGYRLRPITDAWPKPLTPVLGRTLLDRAIEALQCAGAESIFVNTYAGADRIEEHLQSTWPEVCSRREVMLSGPAGALRCFRDDLAEYDQVLVVSGDTIFDDTLTGLLETHDFRASSLTFGTRKMQEAHRFGVLDVDENGVLLSAREKPDVPADLFFTVSTGIYALQPHVIDLLPGDGIADFVTDLFPALQEKGEAVLAYPLVGDWFDIGTPDALQRVVAQLLRDRPNTQYVAPEAIVAPDATLKGCVAIEQGTRVGRGVWIQDAILLPGANIPDGSFVVNGVFGSSNATNY